MDSHLNSLPARRGQIGSQPKGARAARDGLAQHDGGGRRGERVGVAVRGGLGEKVRRRLERHLEQRRHVRLHARAVERRVAALVRHVVADEREVARVNLDAVHAEDRLDLGDDGGARRLDAKSAEHGVDIVGSDLVQVDHGSHRPARRERAKVDARRLDDRRFRALWRREHHRRSDALGVSHHHLWRELLDERHQLQPRGARRHPAVDPSRQPVARDAGAHQGASRSAERVEARHKSPLGRRLLCRSCGRPTAQCTTAAASRRTLGLLLVALLALLALLPQLGEGRAAQRRRVAPLPLLVRLHLADELLGRLGQRGSRLVDGGGAQPHLRFHEREEVERVRVLGERLEAGSLELLGELLLLVAPRPLHPLREHKLDAPPPAAVRAEHPSRVCRVDVRARGVPVFVLERPLLQPAPPVEAGGAARW
mmetsp:Transcript_18360/g.59988  ORF Transcript_18360/g.59988 Transcript_18360/m.59988 type:complete len:425 (+) Transcript_18360:101-1375(+)